jgi:N-methylhydantoinase B
MANNPVETVESSAALTVKRYGIRPDSGGAGKWRGGVGLELTFAPHFSGSQVLGRGMERFRFVPWGLLGGRCGMAARTIRNLGRPDEVELGKIDMIELEAGETITVMTPGGGGYGDPFEREPELVLQDVRRGFVTLAGAARDYGVVIVGDEVDRAATDARRSDREPPSGELFDLGPERRIWESVFDDALMERIIALLFAQPSPARPALRKRIYAPVLACIDRNAPFDAAALRALRPTVEAIVAELEASGEAREAA